jgi:hypothetical protein
VRVYGTISNGEAGGRVTVQFKECGLSPAQFRDVAEAPPTLPDGNWLVDSVVAQSSGSFRATQGLSASNEVSVSTRAGVSLSRAGRGRYRVIVEARLPFWRKRVRIERYDRGRSKWVLLRTAVLGRTEPFTTGYPPTTYISSRSDEFAVKVPRRTKLRAVFPLSQAKPCYAAGTSEVVQT